MGFPKKSHGLVAASVLALLASALVVGPAHADALSDGWTRRRTVAVTVDAGGPQTNVPVPLTLTPATFDYANAQPDGDDLRFSTSATDITPAVPYWIDGTWNPTGTTKVWVRVTSTSSALFLFYGNPAATGVSSFNSAFPPASRQIIPNGASILTFGTSTFDWIEIQAGGTLIVQDGNALDLRARVLIVAGTIDANTAGSQPSGSANAAGSGPGGGGGSANAGGGGGGYGGDGGQSGGDLDADTLGIGGPTYGSDIGTDSALGSSGGNGLTAGGAGGGLVKIKAQDVRIPLGGLISANGAAGSTSTRGGGGGSGGTIMVEAETLAASGTLRAQGGVGGGGGATGERDPGGGGGGGRIKVFRESGSNTATMSVSGSLGGTGSSTGQPGFAGAAPDIASTPFDGVRASLAGGDNLLARPDGLIKRPTRSTFAGNNVFNTNAIGQSVTLTKPRGTTATFVPAVQSDGLVGATYTIKGCASSAGFIVRYFRGATNITGQVVAGTYTTPTIAVGASLPIKMQIRARSSGPMQKTCRVTSRRGAQVDTVAGTLRVAG